MNMVQSQELKSQQTAEADRGPVGPLPLSFSLNRMITYRVNGQPCKAITDTLSVYFTPTVGVKSLCSANSILAMV